jgi:hypothetical protein
MVVYRVVGRTAPWDWAASAEDVHMGTFLTRERAEEEIVKLKTSISWTMEYSDFTIVEEEIIG